MTKRRILLIISIGLISLLTGCGSSLKDDAIVKDIKKELRSLLNENETIDSVEITRRDTNEEKDEADVWVTVTSNDGTVEYMRYYVARFSIDDDKDWYLLEIDKKKEDDWTIMPLRGVDEEKIMSSLINETGFFGKDLQEIASIKEVKIVSQETNLKGLTDKVEVEITLEGEIQIVKLKLFLEYSFDEKWEFEEIIESEQSTVTTKEEFDLNLTEGELISILTQEGLTFSGQQIDISESDVSDFVIDNQVSMNMGTYREYECSFIVKTSIATFSVSSTIRYLYTESNWIKQNITIDSELISINVVGNWKGRYNGVGNRGTAILTISSMSEDGTITGVFSYLPDNPDKYSREGSYRVKGMLDEEEMALKLEAGEWIKEDPTTFAKQDIAAYIYIGSKKMQGKGQSGYVFEIEKE